jgi:TPR repeat protein
VLPFALILFAFPVWAAEEAGGAAQAPSLQSGTTGVGDSEPSGETEYNETLVWARAAYRSEVRAAWQGVADVIAQAEKRGEVTKVERSAHRSAHRGKLRRDRRNLTRAREIANNPALWPMMSTYNRGNMARTLALARPLAEEGDPIAQRYAGLAAVTFTVFHDEGIDWLTLAAKNGDSQAAGELGFQLLVGEATHWLGQKSNENDRLAVMAEGSEWIVHNLLQLDITPALDWFWRAALGNNLDAAEALVDFYQGAYGAPVQQDLTLLWGKRAARLGNGHGAAKVGVAYALGKGVPEDQGQAIGWFLRAAYLENVAAMTVVASAYQTGEGVKQDLLQAAAWYRLAACEMALQLTASGNDLSTIKRIAAHMFETYDTYRKLVPLKGEGDLLDVFVVEIKQSFASLPGLSATASPASAP